VEAIFVRRIILETDRGDSVLSSPFGWMKDNQSSAADSGPPSKQRGAGWLREGVSGLGFVPSRKLNRTENISAR